MELLAVRLRDEGTLGEMVKRKQRKNFMDFKNFSALCSVSWIEELTSVIHCGVISFVIN